MNLKKLSVKPLFVSIALLSALSSLSGVVPSASYARVPSDSPIDTPLPQEPDQPAPSQPPSEPIAARVDTALREAGLPTTQQLGRKKTVECNEVRAFQGAGTLNRGVTVQSVCQIKEPGWIIINAVPEILQNRYGRGSYSVSKLVEGGRTNVNLSEIGDKYKQAIELAGKKGDIELKGRLEMELERQQIIANSWDSNVNAVVTTVTANGGLARKSEIVVKTRVELQQVGYSPN